jgi:hypothetical protein
MARHTLDIEAAQLLATFAMRHESELSNALAFSRMVAAAVAGEEWAEDRVSEVVDKISYCEGTAIRSSRMRVSRKLRIIRSTDCTPAWACKHPRASE